MVFRVNKTKDYTVMSNQHLRDKRMTLKAKGLLTTMLSLPDDWDYSINGLVAICKENSSAIRSALAELEEGGYLKRTETHDSETGKFDYIYDIFETAGNTPYIENPHTVNPHTVNPHTDKPCTENRTQINTNLQNTEKRNTEERNTKTYKSGLEKIIEESTENKELRDALTEFMQFRKGIKKPMTEHALQLLIGKLSKMARTDEEKIEILNQSILNGWQGVYPLERSRDGRTRADAYKGHSTGEYKPVGSGETVV